MDFSIEKIISNFIENQFPRFYQEQGPEFIMFTKAYYEWMENKESFKDVDGSDVKPPIYQARSLLSYRDLDDTYVEFLEHFQQKYLYGIPFRIISDKRFLLKHILDVYRSKGTIQCYRLLFKMIYNQDIEVYLPGKDILKPSDGTWNVPRYLELSDKGNPMGMVGKTIIGVTSKTTAVVEGFTRESLYRDRINIMFLSNVFPRGGDFIIGEAIVLLGEDNIVKKVMEGPRVLGSLNTLEILNGGNEFSPGDLLKIVHNEGYTNAVASFGVGGIVRVIETTKSRGSMVFDIVEPGFGFTANASIFLYNNPYDKLGHGAGFSLNSLFLRKKIYYNTDLFVDYMSKPIDSAEYNFPRDPTANSGSQLGKVLTYSNNVFGSIESLTNIRTGYEYQAAANAFVRSTLISNTLPGNVSYVMGWGLYDIGYAGTATGYSNTDVITIYDVNPDALAANAYVSITTNSTGGDLKLKIENIGGPFSNAQDVEISCNTVHGNELQFSAGLLTPVFGDGTDFDLIFDPNDIVELTDNPDVPRPNKDLVMIKRIVNATCMFLYGDVTGNSTANAVYKVCPVVLPAQFTAEEADKFVSSVSMVDYERRVNSRVGGGSRQVMAGTNEFIKVEPTSGNSVVKTVNLVDSGKGYLDGELVKAYLYSGIANNIQIINPGSGYQNTDVIIFSGGSPSTYASGRVITDENGGVQGTVLFKHGSGYQTIPKLSVKSFRGDGAVLAATLSEFDPKRVVTGRVKNKGSGISRGFWTTTKGFLDADKYIQDSYYYQDYSYEIQTGYTLDKYKDILYSTFHPSGSAMFGKYVMYEGGQSVIDILYESTVADFNVNLTSDSDKVTSDSTLLVNQA
jgi:hypothetical protein